MTIFHERFSTAEVAQAAGMSLNALQNWLKRDLLLVGNGDSPAVEGGGRGITRRFGFRTVMETAVAQALSSENGIALDAAFQAARVFAYSNRSDYEAYSSGRIAGLPWHHEDARSFLIVAPGGILILKDSKDFLGLVRAELENASRFVILDLRQVFELVCERLEIDASAVLDAAYPSFCRLAATDI